MSLEPIRNQRHEVVRVEVRNKNGGFVGGWLVILNLWLCRSLTYSAIGVY